MENILDILYNRGFIKQTVFEDDLRKLLINESVTFYVGFDPTADSLHIGHYIPVMAMAHMQRMGHRPIILIGGGTAYVGDPSHRTDMRNMLTAETIAANVACFKQQLSRFLSFEGENAAIIVDNADWLLHLNYVEFLREIGTHFSVNKMLTAECFKTRMEKGLSFLEFNYMLMQGYDFLVLYKKYGCKLQIGGNDQWSNMLAGADLIRRKEQKDAYAITLTLLENSTGQKMGKTQKGALWLSENKTTAYEFYQYFRNVEDVKVNECLKLLTFMPLNEIEEITRYQDERMNQAKEILAFEVTKLIHGEESALNAQNQAKAAFSGGEDMPTVNIKGDLSLTISDLMVLLNIAVSKSEARRLIEGGGVKINDERVTSFSSLLKDITTDKAFVLHKGKKVHIRVTLD